MIRGNEALVNFKNGQELIEVSNMQMAINKGYIKEKLTKIDTNEKYKKAGIFNRDGFMALEQTIAKVDEFIQEENTVMTIDEFMGDEKYNSEELLKSAADLIELVNKNSTLKKIDSEKIMKGLKATIEVQEVAIDSDEIVRCIQLFYLNILSAFCKDNYPNEKLKIEKIGIKNYIGTKELGYKVKLNTVYLIKYAKDNKINTYGDWVRIVDLYSDSLFIAYTDVTAKAIMCDKSNLNLIDEMAKLTFSYEVLEAKFKALDDVHKKEVKKNSRIAMNIDSLDESLKVTNKLFENKSFIEPHKKEILDMVSEVKYKTLENSYCSQIKSLNDLLSDVKAENKMLKTEKNAFEERVKELETKLSILSTASEYLTDNKISEVAATALEEEKAVVPIVKRNEVCYGVLSLKDAFISVYVPVLDKSFDIEAKNCNQLLFDGAVVVYDTISGKILRNTNYYCTQEVRRHLNIRSDIYSLDPVTKEGITAEGNKIRLINVPSSFRSDQIAITRDNDVRALLRIQKYSLDVYKPFLDSLSVNLMFVTKNINSAYIVYDVNEEKEVLLNSPTYEGITLMNLKEGTLLYMKNNEVKRIEEDGLLLTTSSYYKKKRFVTVSSNNDGKYLGTNSDGEASVLNIDNVSELEENAVIAIDEFKRPLYYVDSASKVELGKNVKRVKVVREKTETDAIEITKKVLIVGSIGFKSNYALSFLKEGVKAETVDGSLTYSKVSQAINKDEYDLIIIDPSHISHNNMWEIKDKYKDKYLAIKENGAQRMVEQVLKHIGR